MNIEKEKVSKPSNDQIIYANLLTVGVWSGIAILITTYAIYVSGLLAPHVDISAIPTVWGGSVSEYLESTHSPHGWNWISLLYRGDFINYIGFVLLALMTIFCYLVLLRGYIRDKNWVFSAIALLEIVVLSIAASGILGSGVH